VIFDFSAVTGIDSSAATSFARMHETLREAGIRSAVSGLSPRVTRVMNAAGKPQVDIESYSDLDEALEQGENAVLAARGAIAFKHLPLMDWLTVALGSREFAEELVAHLTPAEPTGARYLCRQGDPTETLLFIERGRVSVLVDRPNHEPLRVRVFGPHTLVGEIGFFLERPRTASLKVEDGTVVWSLGRDAFRDLTGRRPDIVLALLTYIIRIQAERLAFATRQIAAL